MGMLQMRFAGKKDSQQLITFCRIARRAHGHEVAAITRASEHDRLDMLYRQMITRSEAV